MKKSSVPDVQTPRTKYAKQRARAAENLVEIMKNLDNTRMASIHQAFINHGGGVEIRDFIEIMRSHLPEFDTSNSDGCEQQLNLVDNLCELFWEIDINGDQSLEWDEFSSFIVDRASVHGRKRNTDDVTSFHSVLKMEGPAKRNALNNYIDRVHYIHKLDTLTVTEQHSRIIKLYDAADCSELGRIRHTGEVIATDFASNIGFNADGGIQFKSSSDVVGALIGSGSDMTISVWDLTPGSKQYNLKSRWPTPHAQTSLCWVDHYHTLFSASTAGIVHSWDMESRNEKSAMVGHEDIVTEIITMPELDNLASASMDKTVIVWDVYTGCHRQVLSGHKRGVTSLAFSNDQNLLVSAGFDHEAHVWSPFAPTLLYKLKGHTNSLIQVCAIPDRPQIATADRDGFIKIWDLRTFQCMQTFTSDRTSLSNMTSMTVAHGEDKPRVVVSTKYLHFFDESDPFSEHITHDIPVVAALFNSVSMTILTAAGTTVKVWNALTGRIERVFQNITKSDITSVCFDDRQRKFIVGDHDGNINVFEYSSGAHMKAFDPHKDEVTSLTYNKQEKNVLSTSWDRRILLHDELNSERGVTLREMDPFTHHKDDVSCASFSFALSLIATGSQDFNVHVWDHETGKLDSVLPHESAVNDICFLEPYPLLAVVDDSGKLSLWGVRMSKYKDKLIASWDHLRYKIQEGGTSCVPQDTRQTSAPLKIAWDVENAKIYSGDEYGFLRVFDVKAMLIDLDEREAEIVSEDSSAYRRSSMMPKVKSSPVPRIPETLRPLWVVPAHEDSITSMQIVREDGLLLTASIDCRVKMFAVKNGHHLGTLVQGAHIKGYCVRSPYWDVPYNVAQLHDRRYEFARRMIDDLEGKQGGEDDTQEGKCQFDDEQPDDLLSTFLHSDGHAKTSLGLVSRTSLNGSRPPNLRQLGQDPTTSFRLSKSPFSFKASSRDLHSPAQVKFRKELSKANQRRATRMAILSDVNDM